MTLRAGGLADVADFTPGVAVGIPAFVFKGTGESLQNNTFQNDDALLFTLAPGVRYYYKLLLNVQGPTAADFKTQFTGPGDVTGVKLCHGPALPGGGWVSRDDTNARVSAHGITTSTTYSMDTLGSAIYEEGWVESATGGTFQLQWAQNTTTASNTTVNASSFMMYMRAQ